MKDTLITGKRKKTELITLLVCFVLANLINLYAIISYNTSFNELYSSIGYVFVLSVSIYLGWTFVRILFYLICKLYKHINHKTK